MAVLFFVEAQSDTSGPLLRIHPQIPSWEQRQLASVIISSIPPAMSTDCLNGAGGNLPSAHLLALIHKRYYLCIYQLTLS